MPAKVSKSTTARGLGHDHQKNRVRLLRNLVDGAPCWWCGKGMHKEPSRNWDGRTLNADHETSRRDGGKLANRLLHDTCNKQRGAGDRDHLRPAVTGVWPPVKNPGRFEWGVCEPVRV